MLWRLARANHHLGVTELGFDGGGGSYLSVWEDERNHEQSTSWRVVR